MSSGCPPTKWLTPTTRKESPDLPNRKLLTCRLGKQRLSLSKLESRELAVTTMQDEARAALAAKGTAEQNLAALALCPPWRHAAFAAVMASLVATCGVPLALRFVILAMVFIAIGLIMQSDRRRLGVFINGYRRGKTRLVTFPMLAIILALYMASFHFGVTLARPDISLALALAAFVIGYIGSTLWQRVFVRELGA